MKKSVCFAALLASMCTMLSCNNDDDNSSNNSKVALFASSNTSGTISYTDLSSTAPMVQFFATGSTDADGIYFDDSKNEVIIASRTNNRIEVYGNFSNALTNNLTSLTMTASSTTGDFTNAREIAVDGNRVIVVQDQNPDTNGNMNKVFVYQRTSTGFTLEKRFDISFKLWGIHIENGNLYAVVDLTGDLAVFNTIYTKPTGALTPDKRVTIEGLVRTHGITLKNNTMVLTDVGLAASDSDGGIIVIENFSTVFSTTANGGTIALASQKRIYGSASTLGNPVDVAYNGRTKVIYIAERLNGGGKVLSFAYPTAAQSDAAPVTSRLEPGATGVYLQE